MRNERWKWYVHQNRMQLGITRRELAAAARIDPSYVTLIERDGYVPARDVVERLARALAKPLDVVMLTAGYAPASEGGLRAALHAVTAVSSRQIAGAR